MLKTRRLQHLQHLYSIQSERRLYPLCRIDFRLLSSGQNTIHRSFRSVTWRRSVTTTTTTTMPDNEEQESDSPGNRGSCYPSQSIQAYFLPVLLFVLMEKRELVGRRNSEGGAYVTNGSIAENRICTVKYTVYGQRTGLVSPNIDHARLHVTGLKSCHLINVEFGKGAARPLSPTFSTTVSAKKTASTMSLQQ